MTIAVALAFIITTPRIAYKKDIIIFSDNVGSNVEIGENEFNRTSFCTLKTKTFRMPDIDMETSNLQIPLSSKWNELPR